jgi:glycosyltransferase involved in cell wall biosynthesis
MEMHPSLENPISLRFPFELILADNILEWVSVTVLIPTLNEADNLPYILPLIPNWVDEVLIVDGYSTDNTVEVARKVMPEVRVVMQDGRGKGNALRKGFEVATGDIVVTLDADGSHNPCEIVSFVAMLISGADFVKGSRFSQGASSSDITTLRKFGNWCFVVLTNILFGTRYTDITYGYNATWRRLAPALALDIDGWACEIITNIRAKRNGLRVVELACHESDRIAGRAKLHTFKAGWAILKAILKERVSKVSKPHSRQHKGQQRLGNSFEKFIKQLSLGAD